jgi:flavin reductase
MGKQIGPEEFRQTLGLFATGVTVMTTRHDDVIHGMTANAFTSLSLDPLLVLVCVDRDARMHDLLPQSKSFAVTILGAEQEELSTWFAYSRRPSGEDQFDGVEWQPAPGSGNPILAGGLAWADCRVTEIHGGGDHSIFVGEVVDLGALRDADPLVFFAGRYHRLPINHS